VARYKAEIVPASSDPAERAGTLTLRVFVWTSAHGSPTHQPFFQAHDHVEGGARGHGRGRHWVGGDAVRHRLARTMASALWAHAPARAMREEMDAWAAKDARLTAQGRSITALMETMERGESPAAAQPAGLAVTMRPYQLQSLAFMLGAEQGDGGFRRHFWLNLTAVSGRQYWWSPVLSRAALSVPEQPWGGFCCEEVRGCRELCSIADGPGRPRRAQKPRLFLALGLALPAGCCLAAPPPHRAPLPPAPQMGLGKTVEMLALCLANPAPPAAPGPPARVASSPSGVGGQLLRSRATLVVCAVSLVGQWMDEARAKTAGSMRIHMYHGGKRETSAEALAVDYDLVVTTYATLSSVFGAKKGTGAHSPLHRVKWHRLVLDESHTVKNHTVGHSRACAALDADRRWLCTGTPINTDVADLYGQFAVLRLAPYSGKPFFDARVRAAFGNNVFAGGCAELLYTLGATMIRHTKRQVLGGEEVLRLPPKTEELVPGEQRVGDALARGWVFLFCAFDALWCLNGVAVGSEPDPRPPAAASPHPTPPNPQSSSRPRSSASTAPPTSAPPPSSRATATRDPRP
jgi:hypothetical protein